MSEPTFAEETQTLWDANAAFNRNDVAAMVGYFDPEFEWIEPEEFAGGGTYRGHAEVIAHLIKMREKWAEGECVANRLVVAGDKVVSIVDIHVRMKGKTEWTEGQVAEVYTFRNGKAIQMRLFDDPEKALEWVGVKAPDAP